MIDSKAELKRVLELEKSIYNRKWYFNIPIRLTEQQVLYKHAYFLRKAEYATNTHSFLRYWYLFRLLRIQTQYAMSIPLNVLGEGYEISHLGSVIINSAAVIGPYAKINPGVCIGANKGKAPKLGAHVYLGPGAKVFGDVELADAIQVGANAVVTKSCYEKGSILVGVPASPIK